MGRIPISYPEWQLLKLSELWDFFFFRKKYTVLLFFFLEASVMYVFSGAVCFIVSAGFAESALPSLCAHE